MSFANKIKTTYALTLISPLQKLLGFLGLIFIVLNLIRLICLLSFKEPEAANATFQSIMSWGAMPFGKELFPFKFFTLFTASFIHERLFHFLMNMLVLYFAGQHFQQFFGNHRLVPFFIFSAAFGNLFSWTLALIPSALTLGMGKYLLGASGGILGILTASTVLYPDLPVQLPFLGRIKIIYILLIYILIDFVSLGTLNNVGGTFAHLGGASFGLAYGIGIRKGFDLLGFLNAFKKRRMNLKKGTTHFTIATETYPTKMKLLRPTSPPSLDELLDKIKAKGLNSLNTKERHWLDKYSKGENG